MGCFVTNQHTNIVNRLRTVPRACVLGRHVLGRYIQARITFSGGFEIALNLLSERVTYSKFWVTFQFKVKNIGGIRLELKDIGFRIWCAFKLDKTKTNSKSGRNEIRS